MKYKQSECTIMHRYLVSI